MHCGAKCELREVMLNDIPAAMLEVSSKGTVPVLVLPTIDNSASEPLVSCNSSADHHQVIDESIDIMRWAMNENPARHCTHADEWLITETMSIDAINTLIEQNDFEFKDQLDKYKYSDRHPEHSQMYYLEKALPFLEKLEDILCHSPYLAGSQFRFLDAAIVPFIRQFSMVDPKDFNTLPLPNLQQWLCQSLESELFLSVMRKVSQWKAEAGEYPLVFGKS